MTAMSPRRQRANSWLVRMILLFCTTASGKMHRIHPQTAAAYVLFYRRQMEGRRPHILDRSLSQSFAEEGRALKAKYHPSTDAAPEEEMECDAESQERKRSRNEVGS